MLKKQLRKNNIFCLTSTQQNHVVAIVAVLEQVLAINSEAVGFDWEGKQSLFLYLDVVPCSNIFSSWPDY